MHKLKILFFAILGEMVKLCCKIGIIRPKYGLNRSEKRKEKVIISLTSYGRRVTKVLPYAVISLLKQSYKPDIILLWLDNKNWNDTNLAASLSRLKKYGLTIRYCEDLKSYKKLIPTLEQYPNDIIITCDDDVFYQKNIVKRLMAEYAKEPTCIYAHHAHQIEFSCGILMPYNKWKSGICDSKDRRVFPVGVGSCLYKRTLLYKDVCKSDLFQQLAPTADDVWFYFMEVLNKTQCCVLPHKGYIYIPLDVFYQSRHKTASLSGTNCKESQNDVQIKNVMDYYHIQPADLR